MKIGNISFLYNPRPLGIKVLSLAVICFLFFIPAKIIFTPNDHAGYLEYIDQVKSDGVSDEAKGKVYVGLVYSYIGKVIPYGVFTNIVFLVFIIIFSSRVRNYFTLLAVGVLVAPISAYFGYVTKEALILLILVLAHLCYSRRGRKAGVIVMLAMLFLFSIFVRIYYLPFIIIAVFIAQFGMRRVLLPSFFFGVVGLLLFPEVLSFLYVTKYEMWARLKFESSVVTLFPLSFSPFSSPAVFFEIWLQNVWSIVSAPVRHFGFRGGVVAISLISVIYFAVKTKRICDPIYWWIATLIIGFMTFLVPDSGTFIRHSVTLSLFYLFGAFCYRREEIVNG